MTTGKLTYVDEYQPGSRFFTSIVVRDFRWNEGYRSEYSRLKLTWRASRAVAGQRQISRDDRHVYVGALSSLSNSKNANSGLIYMLRRNTTEGSLGELELIEVRAFIWEVFLFCFGFPSIIPPPSVDRH